MKKDAQTPEKGKMSYCPPCKKTKVLWGKTLFLFLAAVLVILSSFQLHAEPVKESPVLKIMEKELKRSFKKLKGKEYAPLYYLSYSIVEQQTHNISASYGAIDSDSERKERHFDVDVRVGSPQLDNTHEIRGGYEFGTWRRQSRQVEIEDDENALRAAMWLETDKKFKKAQERYTKVKTDKAVKVEEEDLSPDFTKEKGVHFIGKRGSIGFDKTPWFDRLRRWSAIFNEFPFIYRSSIRLGITAENKYIVTSEGTKIQMGQNYTRLALYAGTKAEDGMDLARTRMFEVRDVKDLPTEKEITEAIEIMVTELKELKNAPLVEPYVGPAILMNKASGVFFHEIFGHRMEGHRLKKSEEGHTYKGKIGEKVLPEFISVYDDPNLESFKDKTLWGYYPYDDEGVKAERVMLAESGILKDFLTCRTPVEGFPKSNGHGRRSYGRKTVSRQGNLIVESTKKVSFEKLREMLIEECKKQDKPYGLIFKDITGGFTYTGRYLFQAFKVIPLLVCKVYTDGRDDEVVRGVDIVGTPLTSFSKIIAAGDDPGVFNGYCWAESGRIRASAISPSILVSEIEVEKKIKSHDKPPILPPPKAK